MQTTSEITGVDKNIVKQGVLTLDTLREELIRQVSDICKITSTEC